MDLKMMQLLVEANKETVSNQNAETRDNKAFLKLVSFTNQKLKKMEPS